MKERFRDIADACGIGISLDPRFPRSARAATPAAHLEFPGCDKRRRWRPRALQAILRRTNAGDSAIWPPRDCRPQPQWGAPRAPDGYRCAGWPAACRVSPSRIRGRSEPIAIRSSTARARPRLPEPCDLDTGELVGSGTSSIVGHESRHDGDLQAQIDETLANLRELHRTGGGTGRAEVIKVYLRERAGGAAVAEKICAGLSVSGLPS